MAKGIAGTIKFLIIFSIVLSAAGFNAAAMDECTVWIAKVQDTINPMVSEYLGELMEDAERSDVDILIIELDTPGGLVDSTRAIVQTMMNSEVPVVTYVSPSGARAASAGMFITIASHVAAMAPATNIGAAHPVSMGPGGPVEPDSNDDGDKDNIFRNVAMGRRAQSDGNVMNDKILNDTLAWAKTIAENRNRNVDWVMRAVRESISSTETEALEAGVIDLISDSRADLLTALNGRTVTTVAGDVELNTDNTVVIEKPMTWRQEFLSILINPTLAIYLLALGALGLYFELSHPGFIVPGVVGGICMILGLFAMHTLPINYAGLILIILAFVFFVLEVKITSYGVLTVGGITAFILGSAMLVDGEVTGMQVSLNAIFPLAFAVAAITIVLVTLVIRSHRAKVTTGEVGLKGAEGIVKRTLNPVGQIFVHGEIWRAKSYNNAEILEKSAVVVLESNGLTLIVKPLENAGEEVE